MVDRYGVLGMLPPAIMAAALVYGVVYLVAKTRRARPRWFVMLAEFALVGWALLFLYITQILQFGNGLGEAVNLIPLRMYSTAWVHGLVNAESLGQVGLNILMTLPLGFLLPVVFPRRFQRAWPVLLLGLTVTVVTELVQLATGRSADIDDVIANFLGVAVGYSVFVIIRSCARSVKPTWRLAGALLTLACVAAPIAAVIVTDGQDPAGHVYYGQMLPSETEIARTVSADGASSALYRSVPRESTAELITRLGSYTGITEGCSEQDDTWICTNGNSDALFVYPFNRWSVTYHYGDGAIGSAALVPDEASAIALAQDALRTFEIDPDALTYVGLDPDWGDSYRHLIFTQHEQTEGSLTWGDVLVTVGGNGDILDVTDYRTENSLVERVETISPRASVRIADEVGLDGAPGTAVVTAVEPSFWFNEQTGYLIPTWQITAEYTTGSGQVLDWTPNVDARR